MSTESAWKTLEFYVVVLLYIFEYLFQVISRLIVGPLKYEEEDINGKIAIVTGANSGLGKATAYELVRRGATVVMAGRNGTKLSEAASDIRRKTPAGKLNTMILDLADLKSIQKFAIMVVNKYPRLDILINNAGVMTGGGFGAKHVVPNTTTDGFELHMGTNYLGPFHLTNLLSDHLKKSNSSRIINVSSSAQIGAKLYLNDLMSKNLSPDYTILKLFKKYDILYANSKLALSYFTKELSRRLRGTNVTAYAVCPGTVVTKLLRSSSRIRRFIFGIGLLAIGQTPEQGCETIVYCAISKDCVRDSGRFFRFFRSLKSMDRLVSDDEFSENLWKASTKLVKVPKH